MRSTQLLYALLVAIAATTLQARPSQQPSALEPAFDAVSVKPNTSVSPNLSYRPDGGIAMTAVTPALLMGMAYPLPTSAMIGMPDWASSDRYDVIATAIPGRGRPTNAQQEAMMRALLADRFKLVARIESREQAAYTLVPARSDGRLGPGLQPSDCEKRAAAAKAAAEAARAAGAPPAPEPRLSATGPMPPCTYRMMMTPATRAQKLEGELTMAALASMLRSAAGRPIVDKTGLSGFYRVTLEFSPTQVGPTSPGTAASTPGEPPLVFTALQEQLGLRLESIRAPADVLIIERMERPTEN